MSILIKNGNVVTVDGLRKTDVLIRNGRIETIGIDLDEYADDVIEAEGKIVMPGLIDMHCHMHEPGAPDAENIYSCCKAALQGGFTSIACMPNTDPPIDNDLIVSYVLSKGMECDNCKVYPIGAMTHSLLSDRLADYTLMRDAGIVAISNDGGKPLIDTRLIYECMQYARENNLLFIDHCEDAFLSDGGIVNESENAILTGLKGASKLSEEIAIARDIMLAEASGVRLHIAHVTTSGGVELIRSAKSRGVKVTCETCPAYFVATDEETLNYNTNAKLNPPLRDEYDVQAIIDGIKDGTIDVIATNHIPCSKAEKNLPFEIAASGNSTLETAFAISYTHLVENAHIDICDLVRLMSKNPSRILGIDGGEIAEGKCADIIVVSVDDYYTINPDKFVSRGKNSLFDGWNVLGKIEHVVVNGIIKDIKHTF